MKNKIVITDDRGGKSPMKWADNIKAAAGKPLYQLKNDDLREREMFLTSSKVAHNLTDKTTTTTTNVGISSDSRFYTILHKPLVYKVYNKTHRPT